MDAQEIPASNKTGLGLYVMPDEAFDMWKADPDGVKFLDVRPFEEYVFGGHVEMAKNVPLVFPGTTRRVLPCRAGRPVAPGNSTPTSLPR